METTSAIIEQLESKLALVNGKMLSKKVTVGFDGFVDSIRKPVQQRTDQNVTYFPTLSSFGDHIKSLSGKSGQVELEVQRVKMGGNAPILSNALGILGISSTCLGSTGFPERDKVFESISPNCTVVSLLQPGKSDAIEFGDGKLIVSDLAMFNHYDWEHIKKTVGLETLRRIFLDSSLIAFVDWANLQHAESIWEGILDEIIKPSGRRDFLFYFDLCDPSKKTACQIDEILDLISSFSFNGKVTLGVNTNEAMAIWSSLMGAIQTGSIHDAGRFIHYAMNIDTLLIHPIDRTIAFHQKEIIELPGRLVKEPKVQTGGGDNLNAGYIMGLLAGFTVEESMILGMAASGSYIQEGKSPTLSDIQEYLAVWRSGMESHPSLIEVNHLAN